MLNYILILMLSFTGITMPQDLQFEESLYNRYEFYKEQSFQNRFIKHKDVELLMRNISSNNLFHIYKVGESFEMRSLNLIKVGWGKVKIFLWSQMHGDEPTATAAIFDIFNFFSADDDFNQFRKYLLNKVTLYFLPMVNPDGAEKFQRRNALEIDLNRDARRLESPEAKILKNVFDSLKADFGFNLHDQSRYYSAGKNFKSAAISFLAPPSDEQKSISTSRAEAMKLIGNLFLMANSFIPGHIAKYSDEFEPRAFGDNFQKAGTSTILIESGEWKGDPERQFIRKMNFILLLSAFKLIAEKSFIETNISVYESIPLNEEYIHDFIFRNVTMQRDGKSYIADIAVQKEDEVLVDENTIITRPFISDIGDMSIFSAYNDFDFNGYEIQTGSEIILSQMPEGKFDYIKLLNKGITTVVLPYKMDNPFTKKIPIRFITSSNSSLKNELKVDYIAEFLLKKGNITRFAFVNGNLFDLANDSWLTE